jgi:DNA modification methylase
MDEWLNRIVTGDCLETLGQMPEQSIHLVITSPPYNLGLAYDGYDDNIDYDKYLCWMSKVFLALKRVLVPGGRFALNVAPTGISPFRPVHIDLVQLLRKQDFIFRTEILWYKQSMRRRTAWGCYDDKTKIMTKNGLKSFEEIDIDTDVFVTLNPHTRQVEYQKAFDLIKEDYVGKMVKIKNTTTDIVVTPNHNMAIYNSYKRNISLRPIDDLIRRKPLVIHQKTLGYNLPSDCKWFVLPTVIYGKRTKKKYRKSQRQIKILMDDWVKFLGIWLTDGGVYYDTKKCSYIVSIWQSKEENIPKIKYLLNRLPFKTRHKKEKSEFVICSKQLAAYLRSFCNKNNRKCPEFIFDLSKRQRRIFLDWLMMGDGCFSKNRKERYFGNVSPFLVEAFNLLKILDGTPISTLVRKPVGEHTILGKQCLCLKPVYITSVKSSQNNYIEQKSIRKINYDGKIYCVSVPNKIVLVERNGKFSWCGNSWKQPSNPHIIPSWEYVYVFSKDQWNLPGNKADADITAEEFKKFSDGFWSIRPETRHRQPFLKGRIPGKHPAAFPEELVYRLMKFLSYRGNVILDPFGGTGTVAAVAAKNDRNYVHIDTSANYNEIARKRVLYALREKEENAMSLFPAEVT